MSYQLDHEFFAGISSLGTELPIQTQLNLGYPDNSIVPERAIKSVLKCRQQLVLPVIAKLLAPVKSFIARRNAQAPLLATNAMR